MGQIPNRSHQLRSGRMGKTVKEMTKRAMGKAGVEAWEGDYFLVTG